MGRVLADLPGNEASADLGEWPEYQGAYTLIPIESEPVRTWLGVYSFGDTRHGYLSVFSDSGGWRRTDGLQAPRPLFVYPVKGTAVATVAV